MWATAVQSTRGPTFTAVTQDQAIRRELRNKSDTIKRQGVHVHVRVYVCMHACMYIVKNINYIVGFAIVSQSKAFILFFCARHVAEFIRSWEGKMLSYTSLSCWFLKPTRKCVHCAVGNYVFTVLYEIICLLCCTKLCAYCAVRNYVFTVLYEMICLLCCTKLCVYCAVRNYVFTVLYEIMCLLCCTKLCAYCAVRNYMFTVLYEIICLLCCTKLYVYCAVRYYVFTVLYEIICLLCCTKLIDLILWRVKR
jgi:hypothetical protein